MTKWHSGPPPSMGWWPCRYRDGGFGGLRGLRWWNGKHWSFIAARHNSAYEASWIADMASQYDTQKIQWSARPESWPKRSRT